jgi:hypothetical protein
MKNLKTILALIVLLALGAVVLSGIVYAQNYTVIQAGNSTYIYTDGVPVCQENSSNGMPAAPAVAGEVASGQSIIFSNGVPTTVINANGYQTAYNASMFDFLAGFNAGGPYGVGISSNPNSPGNGTWQSVTQSGTYGTQEPNLNSN